MHPTAVQVVALRIWEGTIRRRPELVCLAALAPLEQFVLITYVHALSKWARTTVWS